MDNYTDENEVLTPAYPMHPGLVLKLDVLPSRKITTVALAKAIHTSRPTLTRILSGEKPVTAGMAARIEAATGYPGDLLVRMQGLYDLATAKREQAERLAAIPRLAA